VYSPRIVQRNVERFEKATSLTLTRYGAEESIGRSAEIQALKEGSKFLRQLKRDELAFVRNEQVLCHLDFRYWQARYAYIDRDPETGGGTGPAKLWHSQEILLERMGTVEEKQADAVARGQTADGIRVADHKARQLGHTGVSRMICMHRHTLHPNCRSMSASVDDDKKLELYTRDKLIYDNLPWFLKPDLGFDVKAQHLSFPALNSNILYQQSNQEGGLGQGRQFNGVSHLTECASWPYPEAMIEMHFFPTLPRAAPTVCILESTAQGRGDWWHEFTEGVRRGWRVDWIYNFTPWYAEPGKYRRTPPDTWQPDNLTLEHAKLVHETSFEFVGYPVVLPREQLYWYQTERAAFQKAGTLNFFLSNWCATPEESFQHSNVSAFPTEFLEQARLGASNGLAYEFQTARSPLG